ncbi:nicotinate-nucleotide-dimethylbenzimidazole phosphoribosyltransferase [Chitinophaga skermanii]|uniref:Nicotinate-nucleotide--dimethylbenzimidazole phosphoribosyltransferase n=1 Tax=Chitinophaga skermanii TaxID=331697 RepID=A0A327R1K6_9BACT|nr:nicotinate-nucleotide--dimethylbenzimidazole phosphoribosyltransferase [Chitinophaga skermanii]RAJ10540.1 nicotinate-nucleotide-dimethylbenzimidazole phosphoribosyltransferase [Chitinophaga skermanii]
MKTFHIEAPSKQLDAALTEKINLKTKPLGALGVLEQIAFQVGKIQQTLSPQLNNPTIIVFAGDHGIAEEGVVNPYPQAVTAQMVYNFVQGGAAINAFSQLNNIKLEVVDAGVAHDFDPSLPIIHTKIAYGTANYRLQKAMTDAQRDIAIKAGAIIVKSAFEQGSNMIGFGEMGIGNTSAAALLMSYFTQAPIEDCTGAGTSHNNDLLQRKIEVLKSVQAFHANITSPLDALATFGGFEIAMMVGAILQAAELKMVIVIDGFIVSTALLTALALYPAVIEYCVFAHTSHENGHQALLRNLAVKPLLQLDLRLGEGTGAALAMPLIQAAVAFLNNMSSFAEAKVSNIES